MDVRYVCVFSPNILYKNLKMSRTKNSIVVSHSNIKNVEYMSEMLKKSTDFNQDIGN